MIESQHLHASVPSSALSAMRLLRLLALLASSALLHVPASGQRDNPCRPEDRTYNPEGMPPASFQPYDRLNPVAGATSTKFYVTVVNLTPHRIRLENTHSYQMSIFDFGDVPQGRARQNTVKYRGEWYTGDDAGEAYYRIDRTDKRFVLRIKSYVPSPTPRRVVFDLSGMGLGQREYPFPGGDTAVTLVITGSSSYGFMASIRHGAGNWMRSIYDVIRGRPVRHFIMPGTHDSGMSKITNKISSIGSAQNTQNQGINIYDQLRAGARWFDLRIGTIHPNDSKDPSKHNGFWTLHVNDEMATIAVGNSGESLDEIISEINRFTAENPGELIFLSIRYLVGRYQLPDRGPITWTPAIISEFFAKLRTLNNRCPNLDTSIPFQNQPASYFLDRNNGRGCVIPLLNGQLAKDRSGSPADGIYHLTRLSPNLRDQWSNKMHAVDMAPDQISAWRSVSRGTGAGADHNGFHIAQWLVTPDAVTATAYSLQAFAIQATNPALYFSGVNGMDPEHWPNVLMVDYIGVARKDQWAWDQLSAELYTLAVGLNLYMASENCGVKKRKSPLLTRRLEQKKWAGNWNGIIFANGTVMDHPPPGLHLGRVEVLKNGTVFGNGTVLERTIPNPWL